MKYVMDFIIPYCVIKFKSFLLHHIYKRMFSWPILNKGVQRGWKQGTINFDMEKNVNFNIVSRFCVFVQFYVSKNTLEKFLKWTLLLLFLVHPNVLSPMCIVNSNGVTFMEDKIF
jgi:hypothetical protein